MSQRQVKNIAASVRQRLLNYAREHGEQFQLVLSRYAMERFLYRLGQSEHRDRFLLKGALLFLVWEGELHRMTRDLDLLGFGDSSAAELERVVRTICEVAVPDDGMTFAADTVRGRQIREDQEYEGIRITLEAYLGTARIPLQIDVGFGDAVTPAPREETFPAMLEFAAPRLRVYPRETVVAEKFQAMVQLGIGNSRMKDFYDVWFLSQTFAFEGTYLAAAIRETFERRRTPVPKEAPLALSHAFAEDVVKRRQWEAFLRKARLQGSTPSLAGVIDGIASFLMIPAQAVGKADAFDAFWPEGGPWQDHRTS